VQRWKRGQRAKKCRGYRSPNVPLWPTPHGCEVSCDISITLSAPLSRPLAMGVESVINFLAPTDRTLFRDAVGSENLRFFGILPSPLLRVEDVDKMASPACAARRNSGSLRSKPFRNPKADSSGFIRVLQSGGVASGFREHTSFSAGCFGRGVALVFRLGSVTSGLSLLGEFPIPALLFLCRG